MLTPALLVDERICQRNIQRMADRIGGLGGTLRPHVKTHKCAELAQRMVDAGHTQGITVSTVAEARFFHALGYNDILYAVGIVPNKVAELAGLMDTGAIITVILDSEDAVRLLNKAAGATGHCFNVLIELDVDGHRAGVDPHGSQLLAIARALEESESAALKGVMTHAGGSYAARNRSELADYAAAERDLSVLAATRLREAGFACPVVSIGSTPTASVVDDLSGVTEVRAGVYVFQDLFQAALGVADISDIALSVATTVIGHQPDKGWLIVDAGWMAMSRDRSTEKQPVDQGYGLVCLANGTPLSDVIMISANQEHGIVAARDGKLDLQQFPVGTTLRILPNHACATAAQFDHYLVVAGDQTIGPWNRSGGW